MVLPPKLKGDSQYKDYCLRKKQTDWEKLLLFCHCLMPFGCIILRHGRSMKVSCHGVESWHAIWDPSKSSFCNASSLGQCALNDHGADILTETPRWQNTATCETGICCPEVRLVKIRKISVTKCVPANWSLKWSSKRSELLIQNGGSAISNA